MGNTEYFLMPDYYPGFVCKMGECRHACCEGWPISMSMKDYFRLVGMPCSDELRRRLDTALHVVRYPTPEEYAFLQPKWDGNCGMRRPDGLCMLHAELGEEHLPPVCRLYPRCIRADAEAEICCAGSCEAVVERLMYRSEPLKFIEGTIRETAFTASEPSHSREKRMAMIGRVQDRSKPLRERLYAFLWEGAFSPAENALSSALGIADELGDMFDGFRDCAALLRESLGGLSGQAYIRAAKQAEIRYPEWEAGIENLLVNHMFFTRFPEVTLDERDACLSLCFAFVLLRLITVAMGAEERDAYTDRIAEAFRLMEHTAFHKNASILIRRAEADTPRDIAGMLAL